MPRRTKNPEAEVEFGYVAPGPGTRDIRLQPAHAYRDGPEFYREHRASFGDYLRELRLSRGLSLRDAATQLGITYSKLQKMEAGGRFRVAGLHLLGAIGDLYGRPRAEILDEAGIRPLGPDADQVLDDDATFEALVLHPRLRPRRMDQRWCDSFSDLQKAQWIEFASKLERWVREEGGRLSDVLDTTNDAAEAE